MVNTEIISVRVALEGSQGTDENGFRMKGCEINYCGNDRMVWQTRTGQGYEERGNKERLNERKECSQILTESACDRASFRCLVFSRTTLSWEGWALVRWGWSPR